MSSKVQKGNPKQSLHAFLGQRGLGMPRYDVIGIVGPSHKPVYTVRASFENTVGQGSGGSRREAEQSAATSLFDALEYPGKKMILPAEVALQEARPAEYPISTFVSFLQIALVRLSKSSGSVRLNGLFSHARENSFGVKEDEVRILCLRHIQDDGFIILDEASGEVLTMPGLSELAGDRMKVMDVVMAALRLADLLQKEKPTETSVEDRDPEPSKVSSVDGPPDDGPPDDGPPDDGPPDDGPPDDGPVSGSEDEVDEDPVADDLSDLEPYISALDFERLRELVDSIRKMESGGEWTRASMLSDTIPEDLQRSFLKSLVREDVLVRLGERHLTRYVLGARRASADEILEIMFPGRYSLGRDLAPRSPLSSPVPPEEDGVFVPKNVLDHILDRLTKLNKFLEVLEYQADKISKIEETIRNNNGK